jgi:PAS domain S-box-containing protein
VPVTSKTEAVKVLVVDDHHENLVALRTILERLDCQVMEATSGAEALKLILKHTFAVILLDVMMPTMDGFETARFIRDRNASKETPIIFLTANGGDAEFIAKGYSEGAVDYLVKPIDPAIVKAKVAVFVELFRRERRILRQEEELRVAERERGAQALRHSEAIYEATFDNASVGIAHTAADGRFLRLNDTFCGIVGYPRDEVLGLSFKQITHPSDVDGDAAALAQLLEGSLETYRCEKRYLRKDGRAVWVHLTVSLALRDRTDRHFIAIVEDISERRLEDDRRRFLATASEALLSSLDYEVTVGHVAHLAVRTIADWCVVDVLADEASSKRPVVEHVQPRRTEVVRELYRRLFRHSDRDSQKTVRPAQPQLIADVRQSVLTTRMSDPETKGLADEVGLKSLMIVPLIVRGSVLGTITLALGEGGRHYRQNDLAMAEDLAHRIAFAIDNARLYREAQNAVEVRDEFLSIASHELRTPLTPLQITFQRLLGSEGKASLENVPVERLRGILHRSERQIHRLVLLIESLLDVSRVAAGGIQLQTEDVDLVEATRDVAARFGDELSRAQCELQVHADGPIRGRWDRLRIEQVITNLVANAIKYGAGKPIDVRVERAGESAVLQVRDQGIGIEAEKLPRLFGRFERAVSARSYGGLGLGLYIARQIVEAHGGTIGVSSQPGVGSVFTVEVPVAGEISAVSDVSSHNAKAQPNELDVASR